MKALTSAELLNTWERYRHHSVLERSLYLLAVLDDGNVNDMARLSIGERDARLLQFREWMFGNRLISVAECPHCSAQTEWEMLTDNLRLQEPYRLQASKLHQLSRDGYTISYRLPNSYDVLTSGTDALSFISGCIVDVKQGDDITQVEQFPSTILDEINIQMSEDDPQADIKMSLACPECHHQWDAPFDIISYLWMEIDNWAKRLIKEIALLARAFGWSENEILTLSHQRRQLYLELVT